MGFQYCLLLVMTVFLSSAYAKSNCTTIQYERRPDAGWSSDLPPDQAFGLCYAYATAELMSQKVGFPVSAIDLSISYNKNLDPMSAIFRTITGAGSRVRWRDGMYSTYEGGFPHKTVDVANRYGICPAEEYSYLEIANNYNGNAYEIVVNNIYQIFADYHRNGYESALSRVKYNDYTATTFSNTQSSREILDIIHETQPTTMTQALFEISQKNCREKRLYPGFQKQHLVYGKGIRKKTMVSKDLHKILESGRKSVGVFYLTPIFPLTRTGPIKEVASKFSGNHVMVISGRKEINGQCYFQIDNTWGLLRSFKSRRVKDSVKGSYYVPEGLMNESVRSITFIH